MKLFVDDRQLLASTQNKEQLNYSVDQHMKTIKKHSDSKKIMKFFQLLSQFSMKYSGMSWQAYKEWAKIMRVSKRTIQRWVKLFVELNIVVVFPVYRKNNGGQSTNSICILPVIKSLVSKVCHGVCHPLKPSINPSLQESDIYTDIQMNEIQSKQYETIMHYFKLKTIDIIKKGTTVIHTSSYAGKIAKSLEKQALYAANEREKAKIKAEKEASTTLFEDIYGEKELPFYNWLDA